MFIMASHSPRWSLYKNLFHFCRRLKKLRLKDFSFEQQNSQTFHSFYLKKMLSIKNLLQKLLPPSQQFSLEAQKLTSVALGQNIETKLALMIIYPHWCT